MSSSTLIDEIGYLPVSQDGAVLFFQLINARHERASTVLTSNKGFEEWGHVLGDEIMAAALIDRLLHHCHIVNIRGNSYRMREHQHWLRTASDEQREGADYLADRLALVEHQPDRARLELIGELSPRSTRPDCSCHGGHRIRLSECVHEFGFMQSSGLCGGDPGPPPQVPVKPGAYVS